MCCCVNVVVDGVVGVVGVEFGVVGVVGVVVVAAYTAFVDGAVVSACALEVVLSCLYIYNSTSITYLQQSPPPFFSILLRSFCYLCLP